jgi:hypothetical protein
MTSVVNNNELGPLGYRIHANPNSGGSVSECVKKEKESDNFDLYKKASLKDDPVAVDLDIIQSQGPGNYSMNNTYGCDCGQKEARDVQLSQVTVNFNGNFGWMGEKGCMIDTDTLLRQNQDLLTNKNYIQQLTEPLFLTTANVSKGYFDVDTDTIIKNSLQTKQNKPCNALSEVTIGNYFTPLIPKLRDEVQDLKHIIPENSMDSWIRGGLPSRQMQRNEDYLRRCQEKTYQNIN